MNNSEDLILLNDAYLSIFNKRNTSEVDKQTLQKVLNYIPSDKFKSFLKNKIDNASTKRDFYFIIQDIADNFSNFSGGKGVKNSLPDELANEIQTMSKKYYMI